METVKDDDILLLLADWVKDKNSNPTVLATALGYRSSNTIHQWIARGQIPRHQADRVREIVTQRPLGHAEAQSPSTEEAREPGAGIKVRVTLTTDQGDVIETMGQGPVTGSNFLAFAEKYLNEPRQETKSEGGVYSVIRHRIVKVVLANE